MSRFPALIGCWLMILGLVVNAAVETRPLQPADFASGLRLRLAPGDVIHSLEVPDQVYLGVTRADLGDLRLFNAQGEVLPHVLRRPQPLSSEPPIKLQLPFFPLLTARGGTLTLPELALRVQTATGGAVLQVGHGSSPSAETEILGYLLDLSGLGNRPLDRLQLHWEGAPQEGFISSIRMEASDDLVHWRFIGEGSLAQLSYGGQQLVRSELTPRDWGKYLRLAWPDVLRPASLVQVDALEKPGKGIEPERHWRWLSLRPTPKAMGGLEFDSGGVMPVDRLQVQLPQPNSLAVADLESRSRVQDPWVPRGHLSLYDLRAQDIVLRNEPVHLPGITDRYWRLRAVGETSGLAIATPEIELGWIPHRLLFLARGDPPFLLAFGSAGVRPLQAAETAPLLALAEGAERVGEAWVEAAVELGGDPALAPPATPLPWPRILLWGVLLFCVLGLGWMAYRLYRQMGDPGD